MLILRFEPEWAERSSERILLVTPRASDDLESLIDVAIQLIHSILSSRGGERVDRMALLRVETKYCYAS